jgi:hypothetical protein
MKRYFSYYLQQAGYGQTYKTLHFGTVKFKQNTDNVATKVNVQAVDGTVNTIAKTI